MREWLSGVIDHDWMEGVRRLSFVAFMPAPPFLGNGGASRALLRFESEDPDVQLDAFAAELTREGNELYRGQHAANYKEFDGVPIRGWAFLPANPRSINPVIIGGKPDFLGTAAAHDGAGYIMMTRDPAFVRAAMGLDGSPRLLEEDRILAQVRGLLPADPSLEIFFNAKPLLDEFSSILGMFIPGFAVRPQVPPVGMNVVIGDGGARGTAFVPASVFRHGIEIYQAIIAPTIR